jgi:hypothetical protein
MLRHRAQDSRVEIVGPHFPALTGDRRESPDVKIGSVTTLA